MSLHIYSLFPPADLKSSQREHSTTKNNLSLSRHQSNLLQAQVDSLKAQLSTQQQEMASVLESHENTEERLGSAGKHMEQSRQEMLALKAKVYMIVVTSYYFSSPTSSACSFVILPRIVSLISYNNGKIFTCSKSSLYISTHRWVSLRVKSPSSSSRCIMRPHRGTPCWNNSTQPTCNSPLWSHSSVGRRLTVPSCRLA